MDAQWILRLIINKKERYIYWVAYCLFFFFNSNLFKVYNEVFVIFLVQNSYKGM